MSNVNRESSVGSSPGRNSSDDIRELSDKLSDLELSDDIRDLALSFLVTMGREPNDPYLDDLVGQLRGIGMTDRDMNRGLRVQGLERRVERLEGLVNMNHEQLIVGVMGRVERLERRLQNLDRRLGQLFRDNERRLERLVVVPNHLFETVSVFREGFPERLTGPVDENETLEYLERRVEYLAHAVENHFQVTEALERLEYAQNRL